MTLFNYFPWSLSLFISIFLVRWGSLSLTPGISKHPQPIKKSAPGRPCAGGGGVGFNFGIFSFLSPQVFKVSWERASQLTLPSQIHSGGEGGKGCDFECPDAIHSKDDTTGAVRNMCFRKLCAKSITGDRCERWSRGKEQSRM